MANMFIAKGNLGKPPTLTRPQRADGESFTVCNFRAFFARFGNNADGELIQKGGFWREIEIYGQKAENIARHLKKGSRVLVVGEEREYTAHDESGNEVEVIKIVAEDVALILNNAVEQITFRPRADNTAQAAPLPAEAD